MTNVTTNRPENFAELKEMAFKIPACGITTVYPQWDKESTVIPTREAMIYNMNNGTLTFVDEDLVNYVIPYVENFVEILKAKGFIQKNIFVPFSNWDYPKNMRETWRNLNARCEQLRWDNTREKARKIARSRNVKPLPQEILTRAREIPVGGIEVKHFYYETTIEPNINNCFITSEAEKLIGTYGQNNGTLVIQSNDGRTYTVKYFDEIYDLLSNAGYREEYQFVPFSNGEKAIS